MKYSLINCYSDYNKGDLGIILTTVRFLQEIDKDADITGISTYNYSDPFYHTQHKLLSKSIPVSPSIFGELNILENVKTLSRKYYDSFGIGLDLR